MTNKSVYLKLLLAGVAGALALSLISLVSLVQISDLVVEDYRYGYMMHIGRKIEKLSKNRPISRINLNRMPIPDLPSDDAFDMLKASELTGSPLGEGPVANKSKPYLWLVRENGLIVTSNATTPLPESWDQLPHPKKTHLLESNEPSFYLPKTFIMKLSTTPVTYLITHNERSLFQGPFLWIQGLHTFTTTAMAVFIALTISFFYLRRKSREARKVLKSLESGNLKARFEIKTFDQFGNLIGDFNRMADEIERLVRRLHDTETSRSNLLQELGHDLRTPLTSLGTSVEALKLYSQQMSLEERDEFFTMIDSDIRYFKELLDKLTIIATIDESHYKINTEKIDLAEFLELEIKTRQTASREGLHWNLNLDNQRKSKISGDFHLIQRLFKNAFDNAARYATSCINVELVTKDEVIEVNVTDDGPGLSTEALNSFGKRRERRLLKDREVRNFSLGLGSVIMKTIAEVHDANLIIVNSPRGGASLKVAFKTD